MLKETLSEKVALVTGGGRGIGRAICQKLAADGALVIVNYASNREAAEKTVADIVNDGGRAIAIQADVSSLEGILGLYSEVDTLLKKTLGESRVDILINNAAYAKQQTIHEVDEASCDYLLDLNIKAPIFLSQQVLTRMPDGGRIINISSGAGVRAYPEVFVYSITKHALNGFTRNLAAALGTRKITVNSIGPGPTLTELLAATVAVEKDYVARVNGMTALGRFGEPREMADAVAFLASDAARFITGQCIGVDGGLQL